MRNRNYFRNFNWINILISFSVFLFTLSLQNIYKSWHHLVTLCRLFPMQLLILNNRWCMCIFVFIWSGRQLFYLYWLHNLNTIQHTNCFQVLRSECIVNFYSLSRYRDFDLCFNLLLFSFAVKWQYIGTI